MIATVASAQTTKTLTVTRADAPPTIDGSLDDPCWLTPAKGDGFILRGIGRPATEQTEFYVCYDDKNIYFGFYCHDTHPEVIKATQTERDSDVEIDDCVQIFLDTYHEHRSAEEFFVNAIGTQRDERKRGTADKISWKGDWHAAAKRVADGWTSEMEIPWAILNYKPGATSMGINIRRREQRLGEVSDWTYLDDGDQYMLYGDLVGMELPAPSKRRPQIMPYVLNTLNFGGSNAGKIGVDIKQAFGEDNTALFTAYPDFGTIENAVKSIDFSYTARRYADNRPFFQEAGSIFSSPYMYTTDVPDFDYGAKVFGRRDKLTYGLMQCMGQENRMDSIATVGYDLPALTHATFSMIGRDDDIVNNKVLSLRLGGQPVPSMSWFVRGTRSLTAGAAQDGTDFGTGFDWYSGRWSFDGSFGRVSTYFNPANGYVDYPGSTVWDLGGGYEVERPGQTVRRWSMDFGMGRRWDSDHGLIDNSNDVGLEVDLANHTAWRASRFWGPHIANYDDPPGTPYTWNSDLGYGVSYSFRTDDQYRRGGISYDWGTEGGGPSQSVSFSCGFLPMKKFSTGLSLQHAHRNNPEEGDITLWRGILSAKYELTSEKSVAARVLYLKEGANLTLSYRQRVRRGLDIFALFGDYNADHTVNRFAIKLISTL